MRFALTQKVLTFALAASSAVPLLISGEIGMVFVVLFWLLFAAGWFVKPMIAENVLYRRALTGVVVALFLTQAARLSQGMPMAMLGMEFTTFLLGIKLLSRAHASDDNQIVILSFLHIIAATVVMTNIIYGVSFLVFVTLSSPMLALSYLRQEIENRFAPKSGREKNLEMIGRLFNSKRIVSLKFLLGSALLTVPILIITGLLFLLFPRIGLGFMGSFSSTKATVGFGKEVVLGDLDIIRLEDTVMMRVTPMRPGEKPSERLELRLRGAIFDRFDGVRWNKSTAPAWRPLKPAGNTYILSSVAPSNAASRYEILLETMDPKLLFIPEGTSRIDVDPLSNRQGIVPRALEANFYGEIRYRDKASVGLKYEVTLDDAPLIGAPPIFGTNHLTLYPGSERLVRLAKSMAGEGSERERANRLVRQLQKNYSYALRLAKDGRNRQESSPLDRFLFARKTGTCEHFSSALTLMLRAVGIPARLVTGFLGADWNDIGGFYSVRKRYAHSWTEVFLDGRWQTLDATPSTGGASVALRPTLLARLVDTLRMRWQAHIVGYNLTTQGKLALRAWRYSQQHRPLTAFGLPDVHLGGAVVGVFIMGILTLALLALRRRWRTASTTKARKPVLKEAQKTAVSLLDRVEHRLERLGYIRPSNRTPLEFLRSIESDVSFSLDVAYEVLARYNAVRFGKARFSPKEARMLRQRIRTIGAKSKSI